jgi:iron complex outermembrane receptor protein
MTRIKNHVTQKFLAVAAGLLTLTAAAAFPQAAPKELSQMTIEDLSTLRVTSASKKEESLQRVTAAIFVITQEDIRRSGATNIPDLLRMVPGLDIAQASGTTWAISSRGFNSQDANKLLVMIDGRTIYSPLVSGVFWEDLDVVLEDIERIEVIRGPGAALWGTNAVNGVINIITKKASDTHGGLISAGGGNLHEGFGLFQYGGKAGSHGNYRVFVKGFQDGAMQLSNGQSALDPWALSHGGFRADWTFSKHDSLSVQGDIHFGGASNFGPVITSLTPLIATVAQQHRNLYGEDVMIQWTHTFSARSGISVQAYFDHALQSASFLSGNVNTADAKLEDHFGWGERQDITWGLGFRHITIDTKGTLIGSFTPAHVVNRLWSGFVQDQIALIPARLQLTVGLTVEEVESANLDVEPDVRLLWTPTDKQSIWAAASRAIHGVSITDTGVRLTFLAFPGPGGITEALTTFGNPLARDEGENSFQAGYRAQVSSKLELDLSGYFNVHSHVRGISMGTPFLENDPGGPVLIIPFNFTDLVSGETHGVEVGANWKPYSFWRLGGGYTWLSGKFRDDSPGAFPNTTATVLSAPHHEFNIRSYVDLPHGFQMDTSFFYVGHIDQGEIPAYPRLDLRLAWKYKERHELSVVGQNLLSPRHIEFPQQNGPFNNSLMKRSVYAKWTFQF